MKRCAVTIMVCLLLGAIINVAVAWGFVLWTPAMPRTSSQVDSWPMEVPPDWPRAEAMEMAHGIGLVVHGYLGIAGSFADRESEPLGQELVYQLNQASEQAWSIDDPQARAEIFRQARGESKVRQPVTSGGYSVAEIYLLRSGWPKLSVFAEMRQAFDRSPLQSGGWNAPDATGSKPGLAIPAWIPWSAPAHQESRRLPTHIIPLGFAVNTACYGGLIALVVWACAFLRRRCRVREGCCTACGYDLRGAAHERCPECGTATASALRHSDRCAAPRTAGL